tara:strand:- start:776 stop:979 length:204 start_codon:yes stop_codon:yes gene_type:complete
MMTDKKRDFIPIDKDPIHMIFHSDKWEEVPDEDLWQDGEIKRYDMPKELFEKIIIRGEWKIIRRKDG